MLNNHQWVTRITKSSKLKKTKKLLKGIKTWQHVIKSSGKNYSLFNRAHWQTLSLKYSPITFIGLNLHPFTHISLLAAFLVLKYKGIINLIHDWNVIDFNPAQQSASITSFTSIIVWWTINQLLYAQIR